jgi:hypothetical protein
MYMNLAEMREAAGIFGRIGYSLAVGEEET